ncbi:hypothetical protein EV175_004536 [Coemansia sp. RSA 1933]|nr:hypothetical protein EV175_004536 [Coemansia sp. RSA 1933]
MLSAFFLQTAIVLFINGSCALAELASIISPLESTVWNLGSQATITYRVTGSVGGEAYEIDLMAGNPDNAQLVYVFESEAKPTVVGVNSATVNVPSSVTSGKYSVRMGVSTDSVPSWKYSQTFTISNSTTNSPKASSLPDMDASDDGDSHRTASAGSSAITNAAAVSVSTFGLASMAVLVAWTTIFAIYHI